MSEAGFGLDILAPKTRGPGAIRQEPGRSTRREGFLSIVKHVQEVGRRLKEDNRLEEKIRAGLDREATRRRFVKGMAWATAAAGGTVALVSAAQSIGAKPWELGDVLGAAAKTSPEVKPQPAPVPEKETLPPPKSDAFEMVFGELAPSLKAEAKDKVLEMRRIITSNSSFKKMYEVTKKWETVIRENARRVGIPEELAIGIVFIENGGGEDLKSKAGARGVAQLMPDTAWYYGLRVDGPEVEKGRRVDERADPQKSIRAMCDYLEDEYGRFSGNLGLTVWSYHAGAPNIHGAQDKFTGSLPQKWQDLADKKRNQVNVHLLLSNPKVQRDILSKLKDETELYVYKAVAATQLFGETL